MPLTMILTALLTVFILSLPLTINAESIPVDSSLLQQLQSTIQEQEIQLRRQSEQLRLQSERLDALQEQINGQSRPQGQEAPQLLAISSGNDRIKLSISGQLNRAVNIVNDGAGTDLYHIDNNASNSRIRFLGTGKINNDLSVGTRIEVAIAPDVSSQVSQSSHSPGTWFDQRWTEISLKSSRFGKLSIGKGDTASNTTAEVDFSRTDLVQYSCIADIAGGMLFREKGGSNPLTTLKVADAFQSRDGLSRQSRLRYDTPGLYGFSLAGSLVSNQRFDAAIFWGGDGYGFKASGAAAIANPKLQDHGLQYDGSLSILHQSSGLNLTLSGGLLERDTQQDACNLYGKIGWIAQLHDLGYTAFGIDYTFSENVPAERDRGWSTGVAIVQSFTSIATEIYAQYRVYSLERSSGPEVANINVGTVGARVKF